MLAAAAWVALTPFIARPFLDATVSSLDDASAGAVVGSFFAVLLLFSPAVVLLGMVSPFAIRLAITDVATAGAVAGRFYALSTVGSLLGTFVPALIAIPLVGTQRTLLGTAFVLAASASLLLGRRAAVAAVAFAVLVAIPPGAVKAEEGLIYEEESRHQFIQVLERDDGRRLLSLNEGVAVHSVWREETVLTGGVWDALLTVPVVLDRPPRRVAILGNAGGTLARAFGVFWPRAEIDGVEIDASVTEVGYRFFGLADNPRVTTYDEDARPFLQRLDRRYDVIYVDAYHQPYVPFYLATRDFFELVRDRLAPGGVVALNVATVPDDDALVREVSGTLATVFPGRSGVERAQVQPGRDRLLGSRRVVPGLARAARFAACPAGQPARARPPVEAGGGSGGGSLDRRPCPGGMGHRPDDRQLRGARRRPRRGSAADSALKLLRGDGPPIRVGHRGAALLAPENTLAAFEAALAVGVDAIEFDVLDLVGGPLVLAHSNDLHEVSHGVAAGTVRDRSLAELRELAPALPTLDEALAFFVDRPEVAVHVDLKLTERLDELAAALERHGLVERTVVSSFHRESLRALARAVPGLRIGITYPEDRRGVARRRILHPAIRLGTVALRAVLARRVPAMLASAGANALMLHQAVVSAETVAAAHDLRRSRLGVDDRPARGARGDDGRGGRRRDHERPEDLRSPGYTGAMRPAP